MMHRLLDSGLKSDPVASEQYKFLGLVRSWERLASVALIDFKRALIIDPKLKESANYKQTVRRFKALANFSVNKIEVGDCDKLTAEINSYITWKNKLSARIETNSVNEGPSLSGDRYQTCLKLLGFSALFSGSCSSTKILLAGVARSLINPFRLGADRAKQETDLSISVALAMHGSLTQLRKQQVEAKVVGVIKSYSDLVQLLK